MSNRKHIVMYEAFASKAISKTLSFLGDKVSKGDEKRFMNVLKNVMNRSDFPISEIDNEWVSYLPKKSALLLRNKENVKNNYEVAYLKFWFSLENGYMGYTGVGNKVVKKKGVIESFDNDEVKYLIENEILENKGQLIPVSLKDLKKLDTCVFITSRDDERKDRLVKSTIWFNDESSNPQMYAIQDEFSGSTPEGDDWKEYGSKCWSMGRLDDIGNDSKKLHKYIIDDEPLRVIGDDLKVQDPFEYNLPLYSFRLTYWGDQDSIDNVKKIEKSDFAIILNIDEMLKSDKKVSSIKKYRTESRLGATRFLSNDDIKKVNIDRYIGELIKSIGIVNNEINLKNLQKVILTKLNGDYGLVSCIHGKSLEDFLSSLDDFIRASNSDRYDHDAIKRRYNEVLIDFKSIYNNSLRTKYITGENISKLINYYEDESNDLGTTISGINPRLELLDIFKRTFNLGRKIADNVSKMNIDNITDLKIVNHKLKSIRSVTNDDFNIIIMDRLRYLVSNNRDSFDDLINRFNRSSTSERKDMVEYLDFIERYIDSIFK